MKPALKKSFFAVEETPASVEIFLSERPKSPKPKGQRGHPGLSPTSIFSTLQPVSPDDAQSSSDDSDHEEDELSLCDLDESALLWNYPGLGLTIEVSRPWTAETCGCEEELDEWTGREYQLTDEEVLAFARDVAAEMAGAGREEASADATKLAAGLSGDAPIGLQPDELMALLQLRLQAREDEDASDGVATSASARTNRRHTLHGQPRDDPVGDAQVEPLFLRALEDAIPFEQLRHLWGDRTSASRSCNNGTSKPDLHKPARSSSARGAEAGSNAAAVLTPRSVQLIWLADQLRHVAGSDRGSDAELPAAFGSPGPGHGGANTALMQAAEGSSWRSPLLAVARLRTGRYGRHKWRVRIGLVKRGPARV